MRIFAPYLLLVTGIVLDSLVSQTTVSGLLGLIALVCLAFILKPAEIAFWAVVFTTAFVSRLIWESDSGIQWSTIFVRSATVLLGGGVCVILSAFRVRLQASREDLLQVIMNLPVPALVADSDGVINLCNDRLISMFAASKDELIGNSFFNYFADPEHQGRAISRYVGWIDLGVAPEGEVTFDLRNSPVSRASGSVSICTLQRKRYVIVCLRPPNTD